MKRLIPSLILSMGALPAANTSCSAPPAACHATANCTCQYCLGPVLYQGNASVRPYTCDGDVWLSVSGLYWKATEDGLAYAIKTDVQSNLFAFTPQDIRNLINAEYLTPKFGWDGGLRAQIGYNSPCDGWDIGLSWTHFQKANSDRVEVSDVQDDVFSNVLLTLWSAFHGIRDESPDYAAKIESTWKFNEMLLQLELGREYWTSRYLTLRPFVGLEYARLDQDFTLHHQGGYWVGATAGSTVQPEFNNEVELQNDFKGLGPRIGLDGNWHLGCGWSLTSHLAASSLNGRFDLAHDENNRAAVSPFNKQKVLDTKNHFRAMRSHLELALGVQYATLLCDGQYALQGNLSWERHLFFHQNQLWRVDRVHPNFTDNVFPNNRGENVFDQSRGTLSTKGLTLRVLFAF